MLRIREIALDGFRGYRRPTSFTFPNRPNGSLLIYGPNGYGKSSITDAFEFLVSPDGTLERLGLRRVENMSGRGMLRHVALDARREASVRLSFEEDGTLYHATRRASHDSEPLSSSLTKIAYAQHIPYIIRGADLRTFIDVTTPTDRYKEFARCLAADRLMDLQSDLRGLRTKLRSDADEAHRKGRIDRGTSALTSSAVIEWDRCRVLQWLNKLIGAVSPGLHLVDLSDTDEGYRALKQQQADEMATARRLPLERAREIVRGLLSKVEPSIRSRFDGVVAAQGLLAEVAGRTAHGDYVKLLTAATELIGAHVEMEACPVCGTPFASSPTGSRAAVQEHLEGLRSQLAEMRAAEQSLATAKRALEDQAPQVQAQLREISALAGEEAEQFLALWREAHRGFLAGSDAGLAAFEASVRSCDSRLSERIERMAPDAPRIYERVMTAANRALELQREHDEWLEARRQRLFVLLEVEKAVSLVDERVYGFIQRAIEAVNHETITFYAKAQKVARVPVAVKVRLLDEEIADSRGVEVLVDMHGTSDLKPRAVLSDSQRHTLALALRLALIRRFNRALPFVVLDDVVTSYDAEHRRDIAIVLADDLQDMQMLILTHDNLFYRFLKSRISEKDQARWSCTSILRYDQEHGPFILGGEEAGDIDQRVRNADPAGNEIRQYVEEWLHKMAHALGAKFVMRRPEDPYNYALRELFDGVMERARGLGLDRLIEAKGMHGFVGEMRDALWLNQASHYQENPYHVTGSAGTDASFWSDFKRFAELFRCGRCGRTKFQHNVFTGKVNCAYPECNLTLKFDPGLPAPRASTGEGPRDGD